jgi:DNA-binding HxlR family transcriptional regulator
MTDRDASSERLIQLLGGRWTLAVLANPDHGRRYQEFHDSLDGISHRVLTETLRRVERNGLVTRHVDSARVETATLYQLTDLGRSLEEPLVALDLRVEVYWSQVEATRHPLEQSEPIAPHSGGLQVVAAADQ